MQLPTEDPKNFPSFKSKEVQEKFYQWGLSTKNLFVAKYRFNQSFNLLRADQFFRDLFNSKIVLSSFSPVSYISSSNGAKVKQMGSQVVNMSFFDFLKEKEIVTSSGYIKKEMDEWVDEIQLSDRLRYALLHEESDYFMEI